MFRTRGSLTQCFNGCHIQWALQSTDLGVFGPVCWSKSPSVGISVGNSVSILQDTLRVNDKKRWSCPAPGWDTAWRFFSLICHPVVTQNKRKLSTYETEWDFCELLIQWGFSGFVQDSEKCVFSLWCHHNRKKNQCGQKNKTLSTCSRPGENPDSESSLKWILTASPHVSICVCVYPFCLMSHREEAPNMVISGTEAPPTGSSSVSFQQFMKKKLV